MNRISPRFSTQAACLQVVLGFALALLFAATGHASLVTWDNDSADGLWKTPANWSSNALPVAGDDVVINNGDTVLWDGAATGGQNLPGGLNIALSGNSTLTAQNVIRLNGATVSVDSGSTLTSTAGGFWDLNNGDLTFENGAIVTIDDWENKGTNRFQFNLGPGGFTTLNPNFFRTNLINSDITDATYVANLAAYTGPIGVIPLIDYNVDAYPGGMNNTLFQTATLQLINQGDYRGNLQWNDVTEAVELNITAIVPEPSTAGILCLLGGGLIFRRRRRLLGGRRR